MSNKLYFLAFGGLSEIGGNASVLACGANTEHADLLMLDLGMSFAGPNVPGVSLTFPDISWLESRVDNLKGICVTHGHEDHIGALPYLWPRLNCPIYCSEFTAAIIKAKFKAHGLQTKQIHVVVSGKPITLGEFKVTFIDVAHSIPGSCMLFIEAGGKKILHTGDWKYDKDPVIGNVFDLKLLKKNVPQNVDMVFCDSTNVFVEGSVDSEREVYNSLLKLIREHKNGRVVLTCFASNIARMGMAVEIARLTNKKLVIVGTSFRNFYRFASELKLLEQGPVYHIEDIHKIDPKESLILCTGSQGEDGSNLIRVAMNKLPALKLTEDDLVIFSSRIIPGNELAVRSMQNALLSQGVRIVTSDDHFTHASGHPPIDDLKSFYEHVKPKAVIPVHGEIRHLKKHADLLHKWGIKQVMVVRDGDLVDLQKWRIDSHVSMEMMIQDGETMVPVSSNHIKTRVKMQQGFVHILLVQNAKGHVCDVRVDSYGLTSENNWINETIQKEVSNYLDKNSWGHDLDFVKIRKLIRRYVNSLLNIDPFIVTNTYEL